MSFYSILNPAPGAGGNEKLEAPEHFHDLNLDQIVQSVTDGWKEYNLVPFFHAPLDDLDAIGYRQEVMRDLEKEPFALAVQAFSEAMRGMRQYMPSQERHYYPYERERWFLAAANLYCDAVEQLESTLRRLGPASRGLRGFGAYLSEYVSSGEFASLAAEARRLAKELSAITYCLLIDGDTIAVRRFESEEDYSAVVEATFEKFRGGAVKDYRSRLRDISGMNHIEGQIVERVAKLHPEVFSDLAAFYAQRAPCADETIQRFDREVQFYRAWLARVGVLRAAGLPFCYPRVSRASKEVAAQDTFDLALAGKLVAERAAVVRNEFSLRGRERIIVVTGPNQGGKTTFARTFGQLHYLAKLGCTVPGTQARLFLYDRLYSHFERQEDVASLRGKLKDDLVRIRSILEQATPQSIIVMNEIFSSTTLKDALFLSRKVMQTMSDLDVLGVCVTFLDELASFDEKSISMVSCVDPDEPAVRTFKVERRPADGLAYALAIARKYRVTREALRERIRA
jgi:DNA mismatch repair protein MutS